MKSFIAISLILCMTLFNVGCNGSEFDRALDQVGPAVSAIASIIGVATGKPVSQALVDKVYQDAALVKKLKNDFSKGKGSTVDQINTAFAVLQADIADVFKLAQVSNPQTQVKITALVTLVNTLVIIIESFLPAHVQADLPKDVSEKTFVTAFNAALAIPSDDPKVAAQCKDSKLKTGSSFSGPGAWFMR